MRLISEQSGLKRLAEISEEYRGSIAERYEHRAKSCITCTTPGACCLDEHFVNVRISRLEAAAIRQTLDDLDPEHRDTVYERVNATVRKFGLDDDDELSKTYACPLYERGVGCIVHRTAKPAACITHACYESPSDLPPDEVLFEQERKIDRLNDLVYGREHKEKPLPVAINRENKLHRPNITIENTS